jgi:hypothetical protein
MESTINITIAIIVTLLGGFILLEFLAIGRKPEYRGREPFKRGLGIGTVLALGAVGVYLLDLHWLTWGFMAALFATAGAVWLPLRRWENGRKPILKGKVGNGTARERERQKETTR